MTNEQKQIEQAMICLKEAYDTLNNLLPTDQKKEQFKSIGEDYGSRRIFDTVKAVFEVNPLVQGRQKEVVLARHALRYLLRKHTMRSLESIGKLSGTNDHKSVLHSTRVAKTLIETDAKYAELITKCEEKI